MAKIRKSIVFNIDSELWEEFRQFVEEMGSYNGRILTRMIEYVLENKEDFKRFVRRKDWEKAEGTPKITIEYITT